MKMDSASENYRSPEELVWVDLIEEELDFGKFYRWLEDPSCGAVVVFSGTVRNFSDGRSGVSRLEYEAYKDPAISGMKLIAQAMLNSFSGVVRAGILHRLGTMVPSDSTVLVGVAAHHRGEAFEAARYGIDELKKSVPIWKKEFWVDGAEWGLGASPLGEVRAPGAP